MSPLLHAHQGGGLTNKLDVRDQIERKRHIGNDIVLVIFLDDSMASYSPSLIKSHFIRTL